MTRNFENTYRNSRVELDNGHFERCRFENVELVYGATGPVGLVGCTFTNVRWKFVGAAENTVKLLRGMYQGMGSEGQALVSQTIAGPGVQRL